MSRAKTKVLTAGSRIGFHWFIYEMLWTNLWISWRTGFTSKTIKVFNSQITNTEGMWLTKWFDHPKDGWQTIQDVQNNPAILWAATMFHGHVYLYLVLKLDSNNPFPEKPWWNWVNEPCNTNKLSSIDAMGEKGTCMYMRDTTYKHAQAHMYMHKYLYKWTYF